jgi:hypothetical protein
MQVGWQLFGWTGPADAVIWGFRHYFPSQCNRETGSGLSALSITASQCKVIIIITMTQRVNSSQL